MQNCVTDGSVGLKSNRSMMEWSLFCMNSLTRLHRVLLWHIEMRSEPFTPDCQCFPLVDRHEFTIFYFFN